MSVRWGYFDKYDQIVNQYMPAMGEGETMASQICTAVCKLVYKWYNDGDVYDNVHSMMEGWCNDLSDYANWLAQNAECWDILAQIKDCYNGDEYEDILKELADKMLGNPEYLEEMNQKKAVGSIYNCPGCFEFNEYNDEYEEDDWY